MLAIFLLDLLVHKSVSDTEIRVLPRNIQYYQREVKLQEEFNPWVSLRKFKPGARNIPATLFL